MQWPKLFSSAPEQVIRLQIEGEPVTEYTLEHWIGIAGMFARTPGLRDALLAEFRDVMTSLRTISADPKDHGDLVRQATRAADLWTFLEMPRAAVAKADDLRHGMRAEQVAEPTPKVPAGARNVI